MGKVATEPLIPSASERGTKTEVAHKWARWLHNPCGLGDPLGFRAGDKIRSGPLVGKVATQPPLPSASERGTKTEVAHKWARWLHSPRRLGERLRFTAGDKNRSGPQLGKVAT